MTYPPQDSAVSSVEGAADKKLVDIINIDNAEKKKSLKFFIVHLDYKRSIMGSSEVGLLTDSKINVQKNDAQ